MRKSVDITHPNPKHLLGLFWGPALLVGALLVGACSSDRSGSQAAAATDPPSTTTGETTTTEPAASTSTSTTTSTTAPEPEAETVFDQLETSGFNGVVAVRDGADITTRAFGTADRENDVPFDAETVFDIGSVTKQFTGAAILRLEMDGVLSVDDTLGEHVPGLPADKAAITLHQLLTHTAGLPAGFGPDDQPIDRSEFLALVGETPLLSEPGTRWEYSNVGYSLLTAVIEFETGEPYEAYLRTALFEPAGMLDTGYLLPDWDDHTIAVGYDHESGYRFGRPNEQLWDVDGPYWNLLGNGGLLSTAADMLRWDEALMGDDVLDATAKEKFFAPHVPLGPGEDVHYSYGWQIIPMPMGAPLIKHDGGNTFFYADLLRFVDQDVAVFVATNSDREEIGDLGFGVANEVLDGALSAVFEDDAGADDQVEADDQTEEATGNCGFDGLSIASLPDHPEIKALPDSPAGRTATVLLGLLAEGDAAARLDFATDHVTEELDDDPTAIAGTIGELQDLLTDYEVIRILEQDDYRFHLLMRGPGVDLLLSVSFDETDPEHLDCIGIAR